MRRSMSFNYSWLIANAQAISVISTGEVGTAQHRPRSQALGGIAVFVVCKTSI